ncbi:FecR domain-containing protein [Methylobacillus arboreus]|uniref:FecR domain-containing protein n=1 Tax=Methylobacillus arboreus TaxID=755170 RepID=UPI001E604597|nr:FecR domain-containing protein [Methylobacillus arboreus]MCB5190719.1 FecR domain-containing protein [Methylobacillus arboreus]
MSTIPPPTEQSALQAAIAWYAQLSSGEASEADHAAWQAWREQSAEHHAAWQRVEAITGKFEHVPGKLGMATLTPQKRLERRKALKQFAVLLAVSGTGWQAYRELPWQSWNADIRTAVGEQRTVALADGSQLIVNTDSVLDVAFSATQRLIRLHQGEIMVDTGQESGPYRPFVVQTREGLLTALGTRFSVRQTDGRTLLSVLAHAVKVEPQSAPEQAYTVSQGMASLFSAHGKITLSPLSPQASSWANGFIYADNLPLSQFIAELQRYRKGWLRLAPELHGLKISGSFPVADTDAVLRSIARTLPVRLTMFTRYIVLLEPRTT